MKKLLIYLALAGMLISCGQQTKTSDMNPFFEAYNTPFDVPPFDKILNAHYLLAFEEGMKKHIGEIDAIVNNAEAATFANTIETLDAEVATCSHVWQMFSST
jgi:peptidyl-dipeptidase Dcp